MMPVLNSVWKDCAKVVLGTPTTAFSWEQYWATRTPTNLSITATGDTTVDVTWNDAVSASDGLKIYTSVDAGENYTYNSSVAFGVESATILILQRDTAYTIKLVAYKGDNESEGITDTTITLAWYDDFESNTNAYFELGVETVVIDQIAAWNPRGTHTASVVDVGVDGLDGYRYWMWWCCPLYEGIGLARSNDLTSGWTQYGSNPVLADMRWPNAYIEDGTIHLFYDVDPETDAYIVHRTTTDGTTLTAAETIVAASAGYQHTGAYLFKNPNDDLYYLFYNIINYPVKTIRQIWCKVASSINGLAAATPQLVIDDSDDEMKSIYFAQFSVLYINGKYWMSFETSVDWVAGHDWAIYALFSNNPLTGWQLSSDSPFLIGGRACPNQHLFGDNLYLYFSYLVADPAWDTRVAVSDLTKNSGVQWLQKLGNVSASIDYSAEQKVSGIKSLKIISGVGGSNNQTTLNKYFKASNNTIKYQIYITAVTEAGSYISQIECKLVAVRKFAILYAKSVSDNWRYHDGTVWANSALAVTTGWHEVIITFGAGGITCTVDGTAICTNLTGGQVTWDEILFGANNSATAGKYTIYYIDDFKVIGV